MSTSCLCYVCASKDRESIKESKQVFQLYLLPRDSITIIDHTVHWVSDLNMPLTPKVLTFANVMGRTRHLIWYLSSCGFGGERDYFPMLSDDFCPVVNVLYKYDHGFLPNSRSKTDIWFAR